MKDEFKGKTIILGVPYHFGLPERFKENLEYLGFEVVLIKHSYKSAKISLKDIIIHNYKKTFKKDRTHKGKIKTQLTEIYHLQQLYYWNSQSFRFTGSVQRKFRIFRV